MEFSLLLNFYRTNAAVLFSFKSAGLAANSVIGSSFIYHRLVVLLLAEDMHQLKQLDPLLKRPGGL